MHGMNLDDLYAQIPTFKCKPGCFDCCGPVPFSQEEADRITIRRKQKGRCCPFASANGCEIYANRPFMCRMFGSTDDPLLQCPHGCGPIFPLSREAAQKLLDKYLRRFMMKNDSDPEQHYYKGFPKVEIRRDAED
jgi:hypothetical protein